MGLINPSLPIVGQSNSSEEPKIVTVESQLLALVNGNLDTANASPAAGFTDGQLASPTNGVWRTVVQVNARTSGAPVITTTPSWFTAAGETAVSAGSATAAPAGVWVPPTASDVAVAGKTTRLRLRVAWFVNATNPGINVTWGLYPVTGIGGSPNQLSLTLGTVIAGSTAAVAAPTTGPGIATGASFDFSAVTGATVYVIGVVGSGTANANSLVATNATLEMRHT